MPLVKKTTYKQALKAWYEKGYADATFGIERFTPPTAIPVERDAYGEGYIDGLEEKERKAKAKKEKQS